MSSSIFDVVGQRSYRPSAAPAHLVIPQIIPVARIVTRNDSAIIGIESIQCWPEGFTITATVFRKHLPDGDNDLDLLKYLYRSTESADPDGPCLGIVFADGSKVTTIDLPQVEEHTFPAMSAANAVGGSTYLTQSIYVRPLPPPGPMIVAARWNRQGLAEAAIELIGENITAAAGRTAPVWGQ